MLCLDKQSDPYEAELDHIAHTVGLEEILTYPGIREVLGDIWESRILLALNEKGELS
jgi:hypothetical protein